MGSDAMDNEELVALVVAEVLRRLATRDNRLTAIDSQRKVLAVFTGGTIGLERGLSELQQIKQAAYDISIVLSAAAEKVIGIRRLRDSLGNDIPVITSEAPFPQELLRKAEAVIVPVLTQNTAAKLAYNLSDTLASQLIFQALLLGKPVIAAMNAADPEDRWRVENQFSHAAPALKQALKNNLKKLVTYGMRLVPVEALTEEVTNVFAKEVKISGNNRSGRKEIIDQAAITSAARSDVKVLTVAKGSIVTPLAHDLAREHNIEIQFSS
jgi:hypothetical protein